MLLGHRVWVQPTWWGLVICIGVLTRPQEKSWLLWSLRWWNRPCWKCLSRFRPCPYRLQNSVCVLLQHARPYYFEQAGCWRRKLVQVRDLHHLWGAACYSSCCQGRTQPPVRWWHCYWNTKSGTVLPSRRLPPEIHWELRRILSRKLKESLYFNRQTNAKQSWST